MILVTNYKFAMIKGREMRRIISTILVIFWVLGLSNMAMAGRVANPTAIFSGIDKITGRIVTFNVDVGETVQFGALLVTPRVCNTSDQPDKPKTLAFVEVQEETFDKTRKKLFSGWMFAASPGLNAVEHAVYDVWLKDCSK
jgi:hypothetical protein